MRMAISSCRPGLVLNMRWDGDRCFVMYGFVKQAQPCHSSPVLQRLPTKTVQGMRDTAFFSAVRFCDKSGSTSLYAFEPSLSGNSCMDPRQRCHT